MATGMRLMEFRVLPGPMEVVLSRPGITISDVFTDATRTRVFMTTTRHTHTVNLKSLRATLLEIAIDIRATAILDYLPTTGP